MITLFSISFDPTTDIILEWLDYFGRNFNRINELNEYHKKIKIDSTYFETITAPQNKVYLRKFNLLSNQNGYVVNAPINKQIDNHLRSEYFNLYNILFDSFDPQKTLGFSINRKWTKLIILKQAKLYGLDIPFSCITNDKDEIVTLFNSYPKLITKPIDDIESFQLNEKTWIPYTSFITKDLIESVSDREIFPSLIQEYIDKEYEIRTFYLDGKCYSMAIFSQDDEQTSVDFRQYNKVKPNRNVPYLLPKEMECKIKIFMNKLELKTGSLDFIRSKNGRYVFLEVNPAGQYSMLSKWCNYNLEKKVAEWLCN